MSGQLRRLIQALERVEQVMLEMDQAELMAQLATTVQMIEDCSNAATICMRLIEYLEKKIKENHPQMMEEEAKKMLKDELLKEMAEELDSCPDNGSYRFARDLMPELGYKNYKRFKVGPIVKAVQMCLRGDENFTENFQEVRREIHGRLRSDFLLSDYAVGWVTYYAEEETGFQKSHPKP